MKLLKEVKGVVTRESTQRCLGQHLECRQCQVMGLAKRKSVSQDKVANTGGERDDESVGVQAGCCAGELGSGGLGCATGGLDDSAVGAVGASDGGCGVARGGDGAGLVCDRAGGSRARHGDSVDAEESRGDIDGGVVGLGLSSEDAGDERKEEDEDGLERAHG